MKHKATDRTNLNYFIIEYANEVFSKGEDDAKNHYAGNGIGDDACVYGRMLGRVG